MLSKRLGGDWFAHGVDDAPRRRQEQAVQQTKQGALGGSAAVGDKRPNTDSAGSFMSRRRINTCIKDSIARSLATATVKPGGSKLACVTQEATIAPLLSPFLVVIIYKPPLIRPMALSRSVSRDFLSALVENN